MFKKIWRFIVGIFNESNDNFKGLLGVERYDLIRRVVLEADKLGQMSGDQKRLWVQKELKGLIDAHGSTVVNWAIENVLLELRYVGFSLPKD